MTGSIAYNIPVGLIPLFSERKVIVRCHNAAEMLSAFSNCDAENLLYVQLLSLTSDVELLRNSGIGVPVDVVMHMPATEFPRLYRQAKLLDKHPVRVSIPVVPGFSKAVKVASALNFPVRLEFSQPAAQLIPEISEVLNTYLHYSAVSQPIEFFHSIFLSFYCGEANSLWNVQEEDPAWVRYVTENGCETVSPRDANHWQSSDLDDFVARLQQEVLAPGSECSGCEFVNQCGCYFKWPNKNYSCDGIKSIFRELRAAVDELKADLAVVSMPEQEVV
jgi:sulfatase maturation enzyme AslB (radical SAM superfamily)